MPKKYNHLHRYQRTKLGDKGYIVYRCLEPGCHHYIRRELVKGKLCKCNRCGDPMIMDARALSLAKPHCADCVKSNKIKKADKIAEALGLR